MVVNSRDRIIEKATELFAIGGYEGVSVRHIAADAEISQSVLYHYFEDKDVLLTHIFDSICHELGQKRAELPKLHSINDQLRQRVEFQFNNAREVVFILKYYFHFRPEFLRLNSGYMPDGATAHVKEVINYGITTEQLSVKDVDTTAKIITHLINGFVLEYYPDPPKGKELNVLANQLVLFIVNALKGGSLPA